MTNTVPAIIDPTKSNRVRVDLTSSVPEWAHLMPGQGLADARFNPFIPDFRKDRIAKEEVIHVINIDRVYMQRESFNQAMGAVEEFYTRNPAMLYRSEFSFGAECVPRSAEAKQTMAYVINVWMGIIDHFGFDAPYTPRFIQQMAPVLGYMARTGFIIEGDKVMKDSPTGFSHARSIHGKTYTSQQFFYEIEYMRRQYCPFVTTLP